MDGNGRWAKQHAFSVMTGHRQGVETLREIIRFSSDIGLQVLSLYAFSTENWTRPQTEVEALMQLVVEFFQSEIEELDRNKVRIRILGNSEALPASAKQAVAEAEKRTEGNTGMQLNIALNYGSREEILRAVRLLVRDVLDESLPKEAINWDEFACRLYTAGQPDVDLLIRTSGEQRLSNFLLCQSTYAEMMFPDKLWPDFLVEDYRNALESYTKRERRFGGRMT
jgi:undecaprenyl diphosphate synthase